MISMLCGHNKHKQRGNNCIAQSARDKLTTEYNRLKKGRRRRRRRDRDTRVKVVDGTQPIVDRFEFA